MHTYKKFKFDQEVIILRDILYYRHVLVINQSLQEAFHKLEKQVDFAIEYYLDP
jgi:hypothetical protein